MFFAWQELADSFWQRHTGVKHLRKIYPCRSNQPFRPFSLEIFSQIDWRKAKKEIIHRIYDEYRKPNFPLVKFKLVNQTSPVQPNFPREIWSVSRQGEHSPEDNLTEGPCGALRSLHLGTFSVLSGPGRQLKVDPYFKDTSKNTTSSLQSMLLKKQTIKQIASAFHSFSYT